MDTLLVCKGHDLCLDGCLSFGYLAWEYLSNWRGPQPHHGGQRRWVSPLTHGLNLGQAQSKQTQSSGLERSSQITIVELRIW